MRYSWDLEPGMEMEVVMATCAQPGSCDGVARKIDDDAEMALLRWIWTVYVLAC